jgi:hypothetical protein
MRQPVEQFAQVDADAGQIASRRVGRIQRSDHGNGCGTSGLDAVLLQLAIQRCASRSAAA